MTHASTVLALSWDQVHRDVAALAHALHRHGPFIGIVGVSRGGLVPAALLARLLDVRQVDTVCVASYDGRTQGEPRLLKAPDAALCGDGTGWLVVDDLVDSGTTAAVVKSLLPRAHFAAVYAKPKGRPLADSVAVSVAQDTWLTFPWEATVRD